MLPCSKLTAVGIPVQQHMIPSLFQGALIVWQFNQPGPGNVPLFNGQ